MVITPITPYITSIYLIYIRDLFTQFYVIVLEFTYFLFISYTMFTYLKTNIFILKQTNSLFLYVYIGGCSSIRGKQSGWGGGRGRIRAH